MIAFTRIDADPILQRGVIEQPDLIVLADETLLDALDAQVLANQQSASAVFINTHVLNCLTDYPITSLCAPPTVYRMLVQQDLTQFRPQSLQRCMAAGEPLNVNGLSEWREATGLTIREGYGPAPYKYPR